MAAHDLDVPVQVLDPDLALPSYATLGDAGADLVARSGVVLAAGGGRAVVPTGIALAIPPGWGGFVMPRSGLAARHGVTCMNSPGVVDAGYRGELQVVLVNTDPTEPYEVHRGDRIAQLVLLEVGWATFVPTPELPASDRGDGRFGSTGR